MSGCLSGGDGGERRWVALMCHCGLQSLSLLPVLCVSPLCVCVFHTAAVASTDSLPRRRCGHVSLCHDLRPSTDHLRVFSPSPYPLYVPHTATTATGTVIPPPRIYRPCRTCTFMRHPPALLSLLGGRRSHISRRLRLRPAPGMLSLPLSLSLSHVLSLSLSRACPLSFALSCTATPCLRSSPASTCPWHHR